jgi:gas vesicle protein
MADVTRQEEARKRRSRKGLVAGLVLGGIVGATAVVVFAPRSGAGQALTGMAKDLLAQAQAYLAAAREQVREAVEEGKATSAATKTDLLARYEAIRANPDLPALPSSR